MEHGGEGLGRHSTVALQPECPAREIEHDTRGESRMRMHREIDRAERKVNPPAQQPNPSVARTLEQIVAQQLLDERQHVGMCGGMESMAAVVDGHAGEFEAAGIPTDAVRLFEHRNGVTAASEAKGRAQSGRTRAKNSDGRHRSSTGPSPQVRWPAISLPGVTNSR